MDGALVLGLIIFKYFIVRIVFKALPSRLNIILRVTIAIITPFFLVPFIIAYKEISLWKQRKAIKSKA